MSALSKFCVGLLCVLIAGAMRGWALSTLWAWFIAPTFHVAALGWVAAWGVGMFLAYAIRDPNVQHRENEGVTNALLTAMLYPVLVVGFAWIVHLWM